MILVLAAGELSAIRHISGVLDINFMAGNQNTVFG